MPTPKLYLNTVIAMIHFTDFVNIDFYRRRPSARSTGSSYYAEIRPAKPGSPAKDTGVLFIRIELI
jgi:hypothetical protein